MSDLLAFKALEFLISLGIIYGAFKIDRSTNSRAWELFSIIGAILAVESVFQIYLISHNFKLGMLEGMFAPSVAVLLAGAGLSFVNEYTNFGKFKKHHLVGYVVGVVLGSIGLAFLVPAFMVSTAFYLGTPLLLLTSIYLFYRMRNRGENAIFTSLTVTSSLYLLASLMSLYLASMEKLSQEYFYSFNLSASLPKIEVLIAISRSAPVMKMTGTMFLGYSVYLFYHGVFRDIYSEEKSEKSRELAKMSVKNIGAIIGEPVAGRMAKEALNDQFGKDAESAEQAAEGEEFSQVKKSLKDKFSETVGPVGERKIKEISEDLKED